MMLVREYVEVGGRSPFSEWFDDLDFSAAARIRIALSRLSQGNLSNVKTVGSGVLEYKLDLGPRYRVYFGRDGERLLILLAGGTKKRQQRDIDKAIEYWKDYKRRKR